MIETYKFRLYPTKDQEVLLNKHFGSVRFIYNWALEYSQKKYKTDGKYLGWMSIATSQDFKNLKTENSWLSEINSQSICNSIAHLGRGFKNFFDGRSGFPKFKSRHDNHQSFEIPAGLKIDFQKKKIQIPKFLKTKTEDNRIKFVLSRRVKKGKLGTATISRNPSGQYFISFIVHTNEQIKTPVPNTKITKQNSLGFDFGLKHFLTLSDGRTIDSPEFFKHTLDKLAKEQRKLSKKQKGSKNKEKQRIKVARIYQKISDQRQDFLHKLSTSIVKENQFDCFCFEDLNLKGMQKLWGRKVSDLSYYSFQQMMLYKAVKVGKICIKIGRFKPSSQLCSKCGHRQKMTLDKRTYVCPECGITMDRDLNAAINIRDFAIFRAIRKDLTNTDGRSGIKAFGDGSSDKYNANCACETAVDELGKFSRNQLENGNH